MIATFAFTWRINTEQVLPLGASDQETPRITTWPMVISFVPAPCNPIPRPRLAVQWCSRNKSSLVIFILEISVASPSPFYSWARGYGCKCLSTWHLPFLNPFFRYTLSGCRCVKVTTSFHYDRFYPWSRTILQSNDKHSDNFEPSGDSSKIQWHTYNTFVATYRSWDCSWIGWI